MSRTVPRSLLLPALVVLGGLGALSGCRPMTEIRIENTSSYDFTDVTIAGQAYGDLAVGETTAYQPVDLTLRYGVLRLTAGGHRVNAQTLNFGAKRFTYRVNVIDLAAGHLDVDVVPE